MVVDTRINALNHQNLIREPVVFSAFLAFLIIISDAACSGGEMYHHERSK